MTPTDVWIVLVTYNGRDDTLKCLRSIAGIDYPRLSTVLVDNASNDDVIPAVRAGFPWCHVVANPTNAGFTGGNNRGIEYALAHGAAWVMLLNNDTTVEPDLVSRLVAAVEAHPDYGIVGPIINYMDEPDALMTDGVVFNAPDYDGFFERRPVPITRATPPTIVEVDIVNGCCLMVAAPVLHAIGLLDDRFFIYHEETDFCLRAMQAGYRCGVIGDRLVLHKGTSSFARTGKSLPRYYDARNLVLLLWKHRGWTKRGRSAMRSALMYVRYIYYRYCVERESGHRESADAIIAGLVDALRGRYGRFAPGRRLGLGAIRWMFEIGRRRPRRLAHRRSAA